MLGVGSTEANAMRILHPGCHAAHEGASEPCMRRGRGLEEQFQEENVRRQRPVARRRCVTCRATTASASELQRMAGREPSVDDGGPCTRMPRHAPPGARDELFAWRWHSPTASLTLAGQPSSKRRLRSRTLHEPQRGGYGLNSPRESPRLRDCACGRQRGWRRRHRLNVQKKCKEAYS